MATEPRSIVDASANIPLAVDAKRLAKMLGMSTRKIRQLDASGRIPAAILIGARSVRWRVDEIKDWLNAEAPDRESWEKIDAARPDRDTNRRAAP